MTDISEDQTVTSPDPVSFSCTLDSYPSSNITWLHNEAEVQAAPPRVAISTVQVDNRTQESNLTLLNTTSEDIGTYTCSAVNVERSTNMTTTELQVLGELVLLQLSIGPITSSSLVIMHNGRLIFAIEHYVCAYNWCISEVHSILYLMSLHNGSLHLSFMSAHMNIV